MSSLPCLHQVFIEGTCSSCKKRKIDCGDVVTVPITYMHPGISLSVEISTAEEYRKDDLRALLGRKKLHLFLDLDNTLLHARRIKNLTSEDKQRIITNPSSERSLYKIEDGTRLVKLRPGTTNFLKKLRSIFDLSIYTMGTRDYAHKMANLLAAQVNEDGRTLFGRIISKEDGTKAGEKGLDIALSDKRSVLIVDDKEDVWENSCKPNVIKIAPYYFFSDARGIKDKMDKDDDDELERVLSTLSLVHLMFYQKIGNNEKDVRQVLRRFRASNNNVCLGGEQEETRNNRGEKRKLQVNTSMQKSKERLFLEKFCAPLKRYKSDPLSGSPCLV